MVAVLLSCYNGEKFLRQQIDSVLCQSFQDIKIIARDDGSSDKTGEILADYAANYPKRFKIDSSANGNLGAGKSFMHLLEVTDADYYMFCDQDDVWMQDKIEKTLSKCQVMEKDFGVNSPVGVFTDLTVVDENLNMIMPSLWKGDNRNPKYTRDLYKQWTNRHATYGCTMIINKAAKKLVLPYKQFENIQGAHDAWIEYIMIAQGHYDYINESTILYRQHGRNVIGANMGLTYKDEVKGILRNPISLFGKLRKDYKRTKLMPFHISFTKVLWYRIKQSFVSILK